MLAFLLLQTFLLVSGVLDAVGIPSFAGVPSVVSIPACYVSVEFASLLLSTLLKSIFLFTLVSPTVACSTAVAGFPPVGVASMPCCCKRLGYCRCLAVAVDPADVNVLAAIGVHMFHAVSGIPDAAGVSVVTGVLAVFGVVPAMSSCMTALFRNCVTFYTFRHF
jgi:hypothetical protein